MFKVQIFNNVISFPEAWYRKPTHIPLKSFSCNLQTLKLLKEATVYQTG